MANSFVCFKLGAIHFGPLLKEVIAHGCIDVVEENRLIDIVRGELTMSVASFPYLIP